MTKIDPVRPIRWDGEQLIVLDQTRLPAEERWLSCRTLDEVVEAIAVLRVRGAPLIGIAAAAGMAIAARTAVDEGIPVPSTLNRAAATLVASRPTAVNLGWAVERAREVAERTPPSQIPTALSELVSQIITEQDQADRLAASFGAELLPAASNVLTHCNTGSLATGGYGSALGVVRCGYERGRVRHVWVDETRPLLQGARLTAWELARDGIPHSVIVDSAASLLMARGQVDAIIVGADRIAANGDVANKIGTLQVAIAARHFAIPFYVAAPISTFDRRIAAGDQIEIEERAGTEVARWAGTVVTPAGTRVLNPAFDVTPAELVTAIVTERGVAMSPFDTAIERLMGPAGAETQSSKVG